VSTSHGNCVWQLRGSAPKWRIDAGRR
jgi:hypothetical protein